ncbi:MAG: methylated-DNA--[protein]-cysteine S-methyltransferase [Candidatus Thiodiazotropha sp. (ex Lucinoma aequizonata)]|nr:methylated-DNA--[protein]-cysteine S-methyltransferase [Candidatus Thiodiazotropha sp. (ex Lucinoma aequizonata)]MCU7911871.1 methylated-DNA--[protein]-cysteine S-methyltransferase [Candidatus Thiodiazotropha sp. (ex Lucinoma aequizonata)]
MIQAQFDYQAVISLPFAPVGITMSEGRLKKLAYLSSPQKEFNHQVPGLVRVMDAINAYLQDPGRKFNLDLLLSGTQFQCRVWKVLQQIPSGKTMIYSELAKKINSGTRAMGNACRANPCPLIIPCHRVVGINGLGGFAGERGGEKLEIKRWLLQHEGCL